MYCLCVWISIFEWMHVCLHVWASWESPCCAFDTVCSRSPHFSLSGCCSLTQKATHDAEAVRALKGMSTDKKTKRWFRFCIWKCHGGQQWQIVLQGLVLVLISKIKTDLFLVFCTTSPWWSNANLIWQRFLDGFNFLSTFRDISCQLWVAFFPPKVQEMDQKMATIGFHMWRVYLQHGLWLFVWISVQPASFLSCSGSFFTGKRFFFSCK